jgi:hypothetical protein
LESNGTDNHCKKGDTVLETEYEYKPFIDDGYEISGGAMGGGEFYIKTDAAPYISNGRTYLPVDYLADTFGICSVWDKATGTAALERGTTKVRLTVDSVNMTVSKNGVRNTVTMDTAPVVKDGRFCVPVRFVAEAFGLMVDYGEIYSIEYGEKIIHDNIKRKCFGHSQWCRRRSLFIRNLAPCHMNGAQHFEK